MSLVFALEDTEPEASTHDSRERRANSRQELMGAHRDRSPSDSGVSTTEGLLPTLRHAESPAYETASYTSSRPPSSRGLASPSYLSPSLTQTPTYLPTPLSQHQPPFPSLSDGAVASRTQWLEEGQAHPSGTPLLRVDPSDHRHGAPAPPPGLQSIGTDATMSAVAASYDPAFTMGPRSFSTWPVMASGSSLMPPDLQTYGSEASLSPPSGSRSGTASPPRIGLTPEQRELKRQRDQARHQSKLQARSRRAESASSSVYSAASTPLPDMTTTSPRMPVYTTAPTQLSLLTEPSAPHYLPSYSPTLPDQSQPSMYPSAYSQSYLPPEYGYPPSTSPNLSSQYGPLASDPSLNIYPGLPPLVPGPEMSGQVRVVHSRPKPQCWDHGCNGRQFSTFSNLLRHQREKSGQAAKATCPNCGAEFTRTTARNGHLLHDKCKRKNINKDNNNANSSGSATPVPAGNTSPTHN
ncbi:hypothetical protein VTJ49DRAFT_7316 [Mycothermus thermophilus]|uniref:Uncharacterized protein n=1 Tax=Humicola insolens TaxID=85995 RepID=A0ABR3VIJ0_HUMIN